MLTKKIAFFSLVVALTSPVHVFANTLNSDQVYKEAQHLKLVNLKCRTVSTDNFDQKHYNCYTNVYNRASQLGLQASKFIDNEDAPQFLIEHNKNYQDILNKCDNLYPNKHELKYKTLAMQCKASNKLAWLSFIPSIMRF